MSECEHSRIERLNMTSMDERHSRSGTPPQGAPVPQPVFVNQHNISLGTGPFGPASVLPQPVSGDVFGMGLDGPARYTVPYVPAQNAQAGPSHLRPPQMFPQSQPYMNLPPQGVDFRYPIQAQMPPQQPEFINLGDDTPQRQMISGWDPSRPVVPSHHRTVHPV